MTQDDHDLSRRVFEEVWNAKKIDAVDEVIAADYVHHDPQSPNVPPGVEGYKQFVRYYLNAFPDIHFEMHERIAQGDTVATRWTVTGTHSGDLEGLPRTGRRISLEGMSITHYKNGKIAESWNVWDALGMMQQLGAMPAAKGRAA
jgi:steroid delta-isomerase-like uncharacterized protein